VPVRRLRQVGLSTVLYQGGGGYEIDVPEDVAYAVSRVIDPETNEPQISAVKITGLKSEKCKHRINRRIGTG
jgi:hypothetical protein